MKSFNRRFLIIFGISYKYLILTTNVHNFFSFDKLDQRYVRLRERSIGKLKKQGKR